MRRSLAVVLVLLTMATLVYAAGGRDSSKASGKASITFLMPTKELPIWIAQGDELVAAFKAAGYNTKLEFAEDVVERQIAQIENATALGTNYLVIAAVDSFAISDAVEKAKAAGITIIADDRLIMNTKAVDYYVTFDLFHLGEIQGQYIERQLGLDKGKKGPFNMEIFSGSPDDPNAQIFYDGEMSILKKYIDQGVLRVKSGQKDFNVTATLNWDSAKAQSRMDNLLSAYYTSDLVDVVLCANDSTALGVISALSSMGYGSANRRFPIITGQDCELTAIKSIINGTQSMSIFLDAKVLAEKTLEIVEALHKGTKPKTDTTFNNNVIDVPTALYDPVLVDKSNWRIVIERGLYTEADFK
jgi:putative multiple sugar transport system substrate-binding protein